MLCKRTQRSIHHTTEKYSHILSKQTVRHKLLLAVRTRNYLTQYWVAVNVFSFFSHSIVLFCLTARTYCHYEVHLH